MAAAAAEGAVVPVAAAMRAVLARAGRAAERSGRAAEAVRVVAVGKTKPVSLLRQLYDAGHRCFGENYVQEFITKAPQLPDDIRWHFVGHLQSNKVKSLVAAVPNLDMVEDVGNEKIANHRDRAVVSLGREPLKVMVQVNTSGEESKSGIYPSSPQRLKISRLWYTVSSRFARPLGYRQNSLNSPWIELGSTNVRVCSTIFGPREYPNQKIESVSETLWRKPHLNIRV
ncbi:unnamed protein product [Alopecurus aequalis]